MSSVSGGGVWLCHRSVVTVMVSDSLASAFESGDPGVVPGVVWSGSTVVMGVDLSDARMFFCTVVETVFDLVSCFVP